MRSRQIIAGLLHHRLPRLFPVLLCLLLLGACQSAEADASGSRVALVVGNGDYRSSPLKNPVNDARDMAAVLKKLDFEVIERIDADKREMVQAIDQFAARLKRADIGLFYFAGHGMQINGSNYLIPVSVRVSSETDVEFEAVNAGRIIGKMRQADNKLNVVILDACRNNPFARSFRSASQGLARMDAPIGTIIAYATGPGSVAADGKGRNGMFTKHLLDAFVQPGLDIQDIFNEAGMQVIQETGRKQVPWTSNTPIPRYYLAGGNPEVVSDAPKKYRPRPTTGRNFTDPSTSMEFVRVDGGCFQMGQTEAEKRQLMRNEGEEEYKKWYNGEQPVHEVCVDGFYMGKYEVTVGQWRRFIKETGYRTDAEKDTKEQGCWVYKDRKWGWQDGYYWDQVGFSQSGSQPVACVSHNDVQEFVNWLNRTSDRTYRLPTEAEWEYAARAGATTARYWGDDVDSKACSYSNVAGEKHWTPGFPCDDGYKFSSPVGKYRPNNFGLYDMLGNVWEWTGDWYAADYYSNSPRHNPTGPASGVSRVARGGSWFNGPADGRAAGRNRDAPWGRRAFVGFRLVAPLPGQ